jgi:hypothetical protein
MVVETSLIFSLAVFLVVFVVAAAAGLHFVSRRTAAMDARPANAGRSRAADLARISDKAVLLNGKVLAGSSESSQSGPVSTDRPAAKRGIDPRAVLRAIHRTLSVTIIVILLTVTIASYFAANPHDGSLLVTGILVMVTLITGLHLHSVDSRLHSGKWAGFRIDFLRRVEADLEEKMAAALRDGSQLRWGVGSPQVHRIDGETLASARSKAAEGRSIDEICRTIDPDYACWSAPQQQAYQSVIRAAIDHGG